jgi:hypothetical protein
MELERQIKEFDFNKYIQDCRNFDQDHIRSVEKGEGSKALAEWMKGCSD